MFGDFSPVDDSLPTNFTQAFHFYHKVRLNGSSDESWGGTKIKQVTLTPIQVKPIIKLPEKKKFCCPEFLLRT